MDDCLIVVDFQNDFITGALGNKEAIAIIPKVLKKIIVYKNAELPIIFTRDCHMIESYQNTHEGRWQPVAHCLRRTEGYELQPDVAKEIEFYNHAYITDKATFGYTGWSSSLSGFKSVEIIGVKTDVCVLSNALYIRSIFPEMDIVVDASCCAGTSVERHKAALGVLDSNHIAVVGGW